MDPNLNQNQPTPIPTDQAAPPKPNPASNTLIVLLVVLSFILFTSTGFLAYQNYQLRMQAKNSVGYGTYSPSPYPIMTSTPDPTAVWKTYTSSKGNYSFKYPEAWPLVNIPVDPGCTTCVEDVHFGNAASLEFSNSDLAVILTFKDPRVKTLDDYINLFVKTDTTKIDLKSTTIGGEKAVSYKLAGGIPPLPVIEYVVLKNGFYYLITLLDTPAINKDLAGNQKTFDEILSTFKFTQ